MNNREWLYGMEPSNLAAWFDAEHVEPNDGIKPESVVRADSMDANDSREKLEDDVGFIVKEGFVTYKGIINLLDRQAAITESACAKCAEGMGEHADSLCDPLKERVAELQRKLEILKAHGVEIVDAVAGGYEVYNEAIRERDELRAKVDEQQETLDNDCRDLIEYDKALDAVKKERDDLKAQLDEILEGANAGDSINVKLLSRIADMKATIHKHRVAAVKASDLLRDIRDELAAVKAERDNLADDLLASNREREHLRRTLGIALDHAHDMLALVNLDGEVVS